MTDDERQARIIIQRWIHKKTGMSESERGLRKVAGELQSGMDRVRAAVKEALDPIQDVMSKIDDEYGVVK